MNEVREGEESHAVQLTGRCCGKGNSALSRRQHPEWYWADCLLKTTHSGSENAFFWACPKSCEVIWTSCINTELQLRQQELPLNLYIMHSTQKRKLTGFCYCYSGYQLSTDKWELCHPLFLEDLEECYNLESTEILNQYVPWQLT